MRKLAYLIDTQRFILIIDHIVQLPILIAEGCIGTIYYIIGILAGVIFQPIDTFSSIFGGGVGLLLKSCFFGFIDIFLTGFAVLKSIFGLIIPLK